MRDQKLDDVLEHIAIAPVTVIEMEDERDSMDRRRCMFDSRPLGVMMPCTLARRACCQDVSRF